MAMLLGERGDMVKPRLLRPWNPEQTLLPPSPVVWLPENHLVVVLLDLAAEVDPEAIPAVNRQKGPRGEKAYELQMMVLLYAHGVGLPSSRKIEKGCSSGLAFGPQRRKFQAAWTILTKRSFFVRWLCFS
jgi:transposase